MRNLSFFFLSLILYSLWFTSFLSAQLAGGSKIIFNLFIGESREIFVLEKDEWAMKLRNLTNHPADDFHPAWSPDGKRIAFASNREGNSQIYLMDASGKNPVRLTKDPKANYSYPSWSPSGRDIAFTKQEELFSPGYIYIIDQEGKNERKLTEGFMPAWSPDSKKIAFVLVKNPAINDLEIFVINVDGGDVVQLTNNLMDNLGIVDQLPSWSPDGSKIVFVSSRTRGVFDYKIYIMDADGGNQRKLTGVMDTNLFEIAACWSPSGDWIAFFREKGIYIIRPDGSDEIKLRELPGSPEWGTISWFGPDFDPSFIRHVNPSGKLTTAWGHIKTLGMR